MARSERVKERMADPQQRLLERIVCWLFINALRSQTAASASADVDETARQALPKEASQEGEADASGSALPELT